MGKWDYVENFKKLGFGMFVHFGLYSKIACGEWVKHYFEIDNEKYDSYIPKFKVNKDWAKKLVATAKKAGCKYITLTTRHHEGFSLYDTKGITTYDYMHYYGRDLVREFVDECNKAGIIPFFYHTLIDWHNEDCENNFPRYLEYLRASIELLCRNYGKIGGFWFDGVWGKPKETDWEEDALYSLIRKYQPECMIINNTGMAERGSLRHPELDSVTFEQGNPDTADFEEQLRPRAGEMCLTLNDHWGYCKNDLNYKSFYSVTESMCICRANGCNLLLNVGPMGNGLLNPFDAAYMENIGKWLKINKDFIYKAKPCNIKAENAIVLKGENGEYFAVVKKVPEINDWFTLPVKIDADIKNVRCLDDGSRIKAKKGEFNIAHSSYKFGDGLRVVRFELK